MSAPQVPFKLRKQMLLMRAAVERVELVHHVLEVRRAATISAIVRNALPSGRSRSLWSRGVDVMRRYPFVASAASLVASRFKIPLLKTAAKYGGMATLVYKLWESWRTHHPASPLTRAVARRPLR